MHAICYTVAMDHQEFANDARKFALDFFATHKIMSWGEQGLRIAILGLHFELRIFPVTNPGYPDGPPIMYLDLVYCGPDAVLAPETMHHNILARVATVNPWEDGIAASLDKLLGKAESVLLENPPPDCEMTEYLEKLESGDRGEGGRGVIGEDWHE